MQIISIEQALKLPACLFIDARSPSEFEQGHIPGAVNVPLLEDDERAIVGTLYKQRGQEEAKQKGLEIVSGKLSDMVKKVVSLMGADSTALLVVYCWRGGMRSKSVLTILELMGISGSQLIGGYKSFRHYVQDRLSCYPLRPKLIVLCGSTGVGKTILLQILDRQGYPVVDLEMLANHRGSAFGQVGRGKPATAQNFDAILLQLLDKYNNEPFILIECESKRVGNVYLPDILYQAMQAGHKVLLKAGMPTRVERLIAEYTDVLIPNDPEINCSILSLTKRLGKKKVAQLIQDYEAAKLNSFTENLLAGYYDPLYGYETASPDSFDLVVEAENLEQAAARIVCYMNGFIRG